MTNSEKPPPWISPPAPEVVPARIPASSIPEWAAAMPVIAKRVSRQDFDCYIAQIIPAAPDADSITFTCPTHEILAEMSSRLGVVDDPAAAILQTVARAMTPGATLLVIDRVLPTEGAPAVNHALMDLHMLVLLAGKERTELEFRSLYERAGFRLTHVVPTASDVSVIEGVRT
jgi:O-methyltransferase domain